MATVTSENIGLLHEKLTVTLEKKDYLPSFEKALKDYSKKANIPGFRKGMVPAGLIKKMYGPSLFTDEVLRSVDRELLGFLQNGQVEIFAQPLPMEADFRQLDVNNPADYTFHFEVGKKPEFSLPNLGAASITRFVVDVTDEMIDNEITRLQNRYGNMQDQEVVDNEENVLNVVFTELNENGEPKEDGIVKDNSLLLKYFKPEVRNNLMGKKSEDSIDIKLADAFDDKELDFVMSDLGLEKTDPAAAQTSFRVQITKVGLLEKKELNAEFFNQLYPGGEVVTESDFRNKIREEIQAYWNSQARNQIHDQLYHLLLDDTQIDFPEPFLKKWMKVQGNGEENTPAKSDEQVEAEFPVFLKQLKWTLISDKLVQENGIQVQPDEIRQFARQQLLGYMGGMGAGADQQPWMDSYVEKMMQDRKYVEDSYHRLQTQKMFEWAETQVNPKDQSISADAFAKMVEEHKH